MTGLSNFYINFLTFIYIAICHKKVAIKNKQIRVTRTTNFSAKACIEKSNIEWAVKSTTIKMHQNQFLIKICIEIDLIILIEFSAVENQISRQIDSFYPFNLHPEK